MRYPESHAKPVVTDSTAHVCTTGSKIRVRAHARFAAVHFEYFFLHLFYY